MTDDLPAGDLADVLRGLLAAASPDLFGGATPAVSVALTDESTAFGSAPQDDPFGPRRESRREDFPLDPRHAPGPYRLAMPPAAGPRVVRLVVNEAVAATLHDDEVDWTVQPDGQSFLLTPRSHRTMTGITGVQVVYGVDAVTATLLGSGKATLSLSGADDDVSQAADLALAVLALDADRLLTNVRTEVHLGNYTTARRITSVSLSSVQTAVTGQDRATCRLALALSVKAEVRRALRESEGAPIVRILTPGRPVHGPVSIDPEVDA